MRRPGLDPAQSPSQETQLLRDLLRSTQQNMTPAEMAKYVRKAHVLVSLEMLGPLSDEEIAARVKAAVEKAQGVYSCTVEVLQ